MAHLLSKAKEAPQLFFVDYMEPYRSYAEKIDAIGGRKQHAGRLLLYKRCRADAFASTAQTASTLLELSDTNALSTVRGVNQNVALFDARKPLPGHY